MKVIDCFMACYESDAIALRIAELAEVADIHHAVQGTTTFRGEPRELLPMPEAVISRLVPMPSGHPDFVDPFWSGARGSDWNRDKYLRDQSLTCAVALDPDALFMVCDGDEIPHPDAVRQAVAEYSRVGPRTLRMDYREWYVDWRAPDGWQPPNAHTNQPVIGTLSDFIAIGGAHNARCARLERKWPYCDATGWHVSNLGDAAFVHSKFGKFAHAEVDNPQDRNLERLNAFRESRRDAIDRFDLEVTDDIPATAAQFPHLIGPA